MKAKIYFSFVLIGLLITSYSCFLQTDSSQKKVAGFCDHIVVTIPGVQWDSLVQILKSNIPRSLWISPDNSKAFLTPSETFPYVEFWNSSLNLYTGSQIALGSTEEEAVVQAKSYYGYEGKAYGDLFTVGSEFSAGHPYGGNFFVSYGKLDISNPNDSLEVSRLIEIRTLIPKTKSYVIDDYNFFELNIEKGMDSFTATDVNGTIIRTKLVDSTPEAVLGGGIGHVSLHFEMTNAIYPERKEVKVGEAIKLIYDQKSFTLILLSSQYEKW